MCCFYKKSSSDDELLESKIASSFEFLFLFLVVVDAVAPLGKLAEFKISPLGAVPIATDNAETWCATLTDGDAGE